MSDIVVGVAVSFTFLNGERHACPYQSVQLGHLHAFVHKRIIFCIDVHSDEEVSGALHTCMSFAPKIAVVVDNHSLLAIRTSDIAKGNISAYLLDNEP